MQLVISHGLLVLLLVIIYLHLLRTVVCIDREHSVNKYRFYILYDTLRFFITFCFFFFLHLLLVWPSFRHYRASITFCSSHRILLPALETTSLPLIFILIGSLAPSVDELLILVLRCSLDLDVNPPTDEAVELRPVSWRGIGVVCKAINWSGLTYLKILSWLFQAHEPCPKRWLK